MKKEYNLREVVDTELKDIKMNSLLENKIKEKCQKRRWYLGMQFPRIVHRVAICLATIALGISGTVIAVENVEGFKQFLDEGTLKQLGQHIQTVNSQDRDGNVRMVVEEAIVDSNNSLIVFSFINEGDTPWTEGIECSEFNDSWSSTWGNGPPTLSEDGRKLTYYVEGFSKEGIKKDKKLSLEAHNLIRRVEYEEVVDIPIGSLYQRYGTKINMSDYEFELTKEPNLKLSKLLKQKKKEVNGEEILLNEEDGITLEYLGIIDGQVGDGALDHQKGLTIYTRNKTYRPWTEDNGYYVVGIVTEITDTRTGKVYTSDGWRIEYDHVLKGGLAMSKFEELTDISQLPYLKATKVTYEVQEVIEEGKWKVNFNLEEAQTLQNTNPGIRIEEGEEYITIEHVHLSALGLTVQLKGSDTLGRVLVPGQDTLVDKLQVSLLMKSGEVIDMQRSSGALYKDQQREKVYTKSYELGEIGGERVFINIDEVQEVSVNGYSIDLE